MLNFGASKPRVKGGGGPPDPHLPSSKREIGKIIEIIAICKSYWLSL